MSFSSLGFSFDGIHSSSFDNISVVRIDSGMFPTPIGGAKEIKSDKVAYRDRTYHYRTDLTAMEFSIIISPLELTWTNDYRYQVFKWLGSREPKEFKTDDHTGKLCYCVCVNAMELVTNCTQGYIELQFEATTPYWLTEVKTLIKDCTLANASTPISFDIYNESNVLHPKYSHDYYYFPKLYIDLQSNATNVKLINTSDGNREFNFTGLTANESIYIDNELPQIETDSGEIVLTKFNKHWFRLTYGQNIITCHYPCKLKFVCQYPIYN